MKITNPIGRRGEDIATEFLLQKGYIILEKNFRKRYGEIDIIAEKDNVLIFIEVKTRTSSQFGTPVESISFWKLQSLMKTAQLYKKLHPHLPEALQIDAVAIIISKTGELENLDHIENITC